MLTMWTKLTLICAVCVTVTTGFQTCLYTSHCEDIAPSKGAQIGHDEYEYCQILQEVVCCFDYNKIRCQQETIRDIDHYLNNLFRGQTPEYCRQECNSTNLLGYSLMTTIVGFIAARFFY